ncbi:MAG: transglutaminase-like domain-containing protein, partial [Polyangiaceae bacterium]
AGPVGGRGDPPFYRLDYASALSTHPISYNDDVIESPADHPIYAGVVNGKADRTEEHDENGRHVVRYVWDHPVNIPDEPLAPPMSETVPVLVMSTFKDWNQFRAWYADAIHGFTEPDAQVRELAAKLTRGKTTREDKLRALFDFVADDIRYVNYVSGEWWLPNRPQQLLARREGDCDDKAILLITLLRAVGIEAQEVMVQTRLTNEPSIVRAKAAAIPLFDHGIAFLPGPGGGTYLDATSPQSRLGPLPSMDARAPALRLDGPAEIVSLPSSSPDDHGIDSTWTVKLAASGSAELAGDERAIGDEAFWMRSNLNEPDARAQWVEDHLVGPWFSTVEVDKKVEFHGDVGRGQATVKWKARSDGLARHEAGELVLPLSPSQTLASQLAPLLRRTVPVWLPSSMAPRHELRTIRVVAPKGWRFEALPQGGDENGGPFG